MQHNKTDNGGNYKSRKVK